MSSVILKKSIVHGGAVYPAGARITLDADTAARLEKAGLLTIQAEKEVPAMPAPVAEEKPAKKAAKKPAAKKKRAAP